MEGSACVYSEVQKSLNEDAMSSDIVMKPLEEEKEESAPEGSQSATHPIWLQQLKQHTLDIILTTKIKSSLRLGVCWTPSQAIAHWIRKLEGDEGNVRPENQHH